MSASLAVGLGDPGDVCGCQWVSTQAVQCPSSRQSRGSQIQPQGATCSCCTEMYSLNSIVFDFSCQNCSRCEFCLRTRQCCAGGAAGFATRCKAGLGPCPTDFRCQPLLSQVTANSSRCVCLLLLVSFGSGIPHHLSLC